MAEFYGKNDSTISGKVPDELKRRVEAIAGDEQRTVSQVLKLLLIRGLSLYEQDGKLRGEVPHNKVVGGIFPGRTAKDELKHQYIETEDVEFIKSPVRRKVKAKR